MGILHMSSLVGFCLLLLCTWIRTVKGGGNGVSECGPDESDPKCDKWSVCVNDTYCAEINDCTDHDGRPCPYGELCCGHGPEKCMCPWPHVRNKKGECVECECPWDEYCTMPHGECACGDDRVRDHNDHCVECDASLSTCPDCPIEKVCHYDQEDETTSCECRPEFVPNALGECVWCQACPTECPDGQLCLRTGFAPPSCVCPPGMNKDKDGNCVPCPECPIEGCTDGKVCVVRDGVAACECPGGHVPHGYGCMYMQHPKILKKQPLW